MARKYLLWTWVSPIGRYGEQFWKHIGVLLHVCRYDSRGSWWGWSIWRHHAVTTRSLLIWERNRSWRKYQVRIHISWLSNVWFISESMSFILISASSSAIWRRILNIPLIKIDAFYIKAIYYRYNNDIMNALAKLNRRSLNLSQSAITLGIIWY